MPAKPTAILFDLDDTLIDRRLSIEVYARRFRRDFASELAPTSPEDLVTIMRQLDCNGYRTRREVANELTKALPWTIRPTADALLDHWLNCFSMDAQLRHHAIDTLQSLRTRGFVLGLVTNGSAKGRNLKIETTRLRPFFSTIVISEVVGIKKPAQAIFNLALDQLNKSPSETWFIGDHPINDMVGASNAGLTSVWLRGVHDWPAEYPPPEHQIEDLAELLVLLPAPA